jgi:hypothetical protein
MNSKQWSEDRATRLGEMLPFGLLFKSQGELFGEIVVQNSSNNFGLLLSKATLISTFKAGFVLGILRV